MAALDAGVDLSALPVEIRRSASRRKTITASVRDGRIVVLAPAGMSRAAEQRAVAGLVANLQRRRMRYAGSAGDDDLMRRAGELSRRYLHGRARPTGVTWVSNQHSRWGSCTPSTGRIRISETVRPLPAFVVDYVLLHELAHLLVPGHGAEFWAVLSSYPRLERARGYLQGYAAANGLPPLPHEDSDPAVGHAAGGAGADDKADGTAVDGADSAD